MILPLNHTVWPAVPEIEEEHKKIFSEQGFLAFESVLTPEEVAEAKTAISRCVRRYAFNDTLGAYTPPRGDGATAGGACFQSRSSRFFYQTEQGYIPSPDKADELELKVRKLMWFEREEPVFTSMVWDHPRIQPVLDALLGPGAVMFQSMALIKPPFIGCEKPWHQDNAYFAVAPLEAVLGIWIALDDATVENGCMHVIPGGHKAGAIRHHHDKDCEIDAGRLDVSKAVPVELRAGGAMFFAGMIPHQTPANSSPQRRRALQFHYHAAHARTLETPEYDRLYAEVDGTPASCAAARAAGI